MTFARPVLPRRTDAELMTLIASGTSSALGEIYDRYYADVHRVLARVASNAADVDDLVQTTFLELPKIAASFDGRESARAWIIGVAVRLASRRRRSLARWFRALGALVHVVPAHTDGDPETSARERQELSLFERALADLSVEKRSVFVLIEIEGVPSADVARSLEIPPTTVRTRLFKARAELRAAMKGVRC